MNRKAKDLGTGLLVVAPTALYWLTGAQQWPIWVAVPVACAVSAGIILASVAQARHWRGMAERYLGVPETGEAPGDFEAWRRGVRAEAGRRYGPEAARLTLQAAGRGFLGQALFDTAGVVAVCSLACGSALGNLAGGGACMAASIIFSWMGVVAAKAAEDTARTAGIERGAMRGFFMARAKYLHWYEQRDQDPYPFAHLG
jgi:hypothetical protein